MLMNNVDSDSRSQPLPPKRASGKRPVSELAKGMSYMRRFTNRRGEVMERDVLPYKGRLYVITNSLLIDYELRDPPASTIIPANRDFTGVNTAIIEALESFGRYWRDFDKGVKPAPHLRKLPLKLSHGVIADDIYMNADTVVERSGRDGKEWPFETRYEFASGAPRTMRFDRKAFVQVMKVATEINFQSDPVCFHYKHGLRCP
ncbi:MAG: hypothetical protein R3D84_12660 [Paracoccaceae bacterium]